MCIRDSLLFVPFTLEYLKQSGRLPSVVSFVGNMLSIKPICLSLIHIYPSGRANGRGAYICKDSECLKKAIKTKALNRAFKVEVSDEVYEKLLAELESYDK